jgi:hypothetical protein
MNPAVDPGPCLLDIFEFQQPTRPPTRHVLTLAAGLTNQGGAQLAGRGSAAVCLSSSSGCHSADLGMPGERSPGSGIYELPGDEPSRALGGPLVFITRLPAG